MSCQREAQKSTTKEGQRTKKQRNTQATHKQHNKTHHTTKHTHRNRNRNNTTQHRSNHKQHTSTSATTTHDTIPSKPHQLHPLCFPDSLVLGACSSVSMCALCVCALLVFVGSCVRVLLLCFCVVLLRVICWACSGREAMKFIGTMVIEQKHNRDREGGGEGGRPRGRNMETWHGRRLVLASHQIRAAQGGAWLM